MKSKRSWLRWLILLGLLLGLSQPVTAQSNIPFTGYTPANWSWWCSENGCLLLPTDAASGAQARFFLVAQGDPSEAWLPAWLGGGEVTWQGAIKAGGQEWNARLAQGSGRRGLISVNRDRTWALAAIAPADQWAALAPLFNLVLKGGTK